MLALALGGPRSKAHHDACVAKISALSQVEIRDPAEPVAFPSRLRVAAWNVERCFYIAETRGLIERSAADIVLLTEVDQGMARTGNLHTVAELAGESGAGFIYGVEFVETGRGSPREAALHPELENTASFHGNAILSRLRLADAFIVRLDDGGVWYQGKSGDRELRLGYRNAIVARIADAPRPLWVASVHLESSSDAADRAAQVRRLTDILAERVGDDAIILGGDFNTNALRAATGDIAGLLPEVERHEPMFAVLREAGYHWAGLNDTVITQRTRPDGMPQPPFARLDWLFAKGVSGTDAISIAATDDAGSAISDHDAVAAIFTL